MQPGMNQTIPNPYASRNTMTPWSQQPPGVTNPVNELQSSPPPVVTSPRVYSNFQQDQANIQMINPDTEKETTDFKEQAKILGGIQVVVGVMHFGFGIILGLMTTTYATVLGFASFSFISGYTFWGGLSFTISGSLSISASKAFSLRLLKGSLGMNIVSAIFAGIGVILLVVDMSINGVPKQDHWALISGKGISAMLMIFSLLEFCITSISAHSAVRAIHYSSAPFLIIPTMFANPSASAPSPAPLTNVGQPAYVPSY